jgi:CTP synthase
MRQFQFRVGADNFCLIHVSLVPLVGSVGEQKTKPTQSSVRDLRGLGLNPDFLACRSAKPLEESIKAKLSMFCHVPEKQVLAVHDVSSVWHVPLLLHEQGLLTTLQSRLKLDAIPLTSVSKENGAELWRKWNKLATTFSNLQKSVSIALVGKYTNLQDSYASVSKALVHAGLVSNRKVNIRWVEATDLEPEAEAADPIAYHDAWKKVCSADGILVPGGFGERGFEGKILAAKWARENKIPYLGICLGLQVATVEFARNVCGITGAESAEFKPETDTPLIVYMPEISKTHMGGTMRLGTRPTIFQPNTENSIIRKLYGSKESVDERHRHRYEVNPEYVEQIEKKGLKYVGKDEKGERMEILELEDHPYYIGVQYHPEYLSRPLKPSPPFLGLVLASAGLLDNSLSKLDRFTSHTYESNSE